MLEMRILGPDRSNFDKLEQLKSTLEDCLLEEAK